MSSSQRPSLQRHSTLSPDLYPKFTGSTRLKYGRHSEGELLDFIKAEIRKFRARPSSSQQRALSRCYSPRKEYKNVTMKVFLKNMMSVFDDLFFGSTIAPRTYLKYLGLSDSFDGTFYTHGDNGTGQIEFYDIVNSGRTHTQDLWAYAETMLHEMVHAYIRYYIDWGNGFEGLAHLKSLEVKGKGGHGFLWQDIAYMVEREFNAKTGAKLDIGRPKALQQELNLWKKSDWRHVNVARRWEIYF